MANLTTTADIDAFMASLDKAAARSNLDLGLLSNPSANLLIQQNADNAQEFRVYGAVTGGNYAELSCSAIGDVTIGSPTGNVVIAPSGATRMEFNGFQSIIHSSLLPNATNSRDLGAAALRFKEMYLGTKLDLLSAPIDTNLTTEDEGFIDFSATADADSTSAISTLATSGATTHHIQVKINGVKAWIPVSTNAPS